MMQQEPRSGGNFSAPGNFCLVDRDSSVVHWPTSYEALRHTRTTRRRSFIPIRLGTRWNRFRFRDDRKNFRDDERCSQLSRFLPWTFMVMTSRICWSRVAGCGAGGGGGGGGGARRGAAAGAPRAN